MKRLISIILCTTMLISMLAGCNNATATPGGSSSTNASSSAEEVELTMWVFPLFDGYDKMMQVDFPTAVKAAYPNITLKTEILSWDAGPEKLTLAMATGATPDILDDGLSRLASGINAGLCADLTDLAGELSSLYLENYLKQGMMDGKNYYLADKTANAYNLTVNTTLAKELGVYDLLPEDKIHWSYAEFLDFCRAAQTAGKSKRVYATQLWAGSRSSDAVYYSWLMAGGTDILNSDHTALAANTDTAKSTLKVFKTLIDEKLVPEGAATTKDEDIDPIFFSGKTVLQLTSAGAQTPITIYDKTQNGEIEGFETESIQIPTPDGKADPRVASWGTAGIVVFKNADDAAKIAAAKNVIKVYFNSKDMMTEICLKSGQASTLNTVNLDYGDDTLNAQVKAANIANAKYSVSDFGILEPWWSDFRETYYVQLQAYYTGTKTVDQALNDWETTANTAIEKALAAK